MAEEKAQGNAAWAEDAIERARTADSSWERDVAQTQALTYALLAIADAIRSTSQPRLGVTAGSVQVLATGPGTSPAAAAAAMSLRGRTT